MGEWLLHPLRKHFQSMGVPYSHLLMVPKLLANLMSPTYKEVEWIVGKGESIAGQNILPVWSIQLDAKKAQLSIGSSDPR